MPGFAERFTRGSLRWLRGYASRYVATSAGRVHVLESGPRAPSRIAGDEPPLVLLHGLSSAGVHFFPLLRHLDRRIGRIIVPDLPGHGFSERPGRMAPDVLHRGVLESLDAVLDEPALLVGNSLGGLAAIRYALARPERVRGLLLASPAGAQMSEAELVALRESFRLTGHREALAFVDRLLARPSRIRHVYAWGVRRQMAHPAVGELLDTAAPDLLLRPDELAAIPHPTLLLWGQAERILPPSSLAFFEAHLPAHARIERPEGLGHSPFLDDAHRVARRTLAFYEELRVRPPAQR